MNLFNAEKSLKHWLKNRVSVTTATVVGFLIMGTVSFGEQVLEKKEINTPTTEHIVVNTANSIIDINEKGSIKLNNIVHKNIQGITLEKGGTVNNNGNINITGLRDTWGTNGIISKGDLNLTNNKNIEIDTEGSQVAEAIKIENGKATIHNTGTIKVNSKRIDGNGNAYGIVINNSNVDTNTPSSTIFNGTTLTEGNISVTSVKSAVGISSNTNIDFTNSKGNITVTGTEGAKGLVLEGKKSTVKNYDNISVTSDKLAVGIDSNNQFDITNEGTINVLSKTSNATGIEIYNVKENSNIINNGTIFAKSENGASAFAISTPVALSIPANKELKITNTKDGFLIGESVKKEISAGAVVNLKNTGEGKIIFNNEGTIKVTKGTGVNTQGNVEVTNKGRIELDSKSIAFNNVFGGSINSTGTMQITDKTVEELKDFNINGIISTNSKNGITITGQLEDKNGKHIENQGTSSYIGGPLNTSTINNAGKSLNSVTLGKQAETKITNETNDNIKLASLNIIGKVGVVANKNNNVISNEPVTIENTTINLDKDGIFNVGGYVMNHFVETKGATLSIIGNNVNKFKNGIAVNLTNGSTLKLTDVTFNGGVSSDDNVSNNIDIFGKTSINGELGVSKINVGTNAKANTSDKLILSSNSKFTKATTLTNNTTGVTVFEIGKELENALVNSEANAEVTITGKIDFDISSITKDEDIDLFGGTTHNLAGAEYKELTDQVYNTSLNKESGTLSVRYNKKLFGDNEILNNINNNAQIVNGNLSQNVAERKIQLDKIYAQNIYTETVKAFYDTLKSTEKEVLSLNHDVKPNEIKSYGKVLYSKNDYTKDGTVGSYDIKAETSGLLASIEYGLTDTMKTGIVFSGSKQKIDAMGGNADADLFYFGAYGNKTYGNYDLTAGLGYQLGKYEAKNNIGNVAEEDKYSSKALNGYVQGKYSFNFEEGISIEPKVKLGYTHLKQDNAKGSYFGVSDAEINTFDTEIGVDVVKSVQFEKSKLNLTLGTSYVKTMGDTDKMFKGHFYGDNTSNNFNVLGAELSENIIKFNLGAELENENGFFYNGSLTYEFGENDTKSYGANIGIGYKF